MIQIFSGSIGKVNEWLKNNPDIKVQGVTNFITSDHGYNEYFASVVYETEGQENKEGR